MAKLDFPSPIGAGHSWKDPNGVVWVYDGKRWTRNSRSGGAVTPPTPPDDVYTEASEAAQLGLASKQGDICIRTDLTPQIAYKMRTNVNGTMGNWQRLGTVDSNFGELT